MTFQMKRASPVPLALAALGWVATPMGLVRPFGAQTSGEIAVAYAMRRWGAPLTLLLLVLGLVAAGHGLRHPWLPRQAVPRIDPMG